MFPLLGPRQPHIYDLYAVAVHAGHSLQSGHYYSYVKAPNCSWYRCDDETVSTASESTALSQKAYLLFYISRDAVSRAGALASLKPQRAIEAVLAATATRQNPAPVPTDSDESESDGGDAQEPGEDEGKPSWAPEAHRFLEARTRRANRELIQITGEEPQFLQLQTPRHPRVPKKVQLRPQVLRVMLSGSRAQRRRNDIQNSMRGHSPARTAANSDEEASPGDAVHVGMRGVHTRARSLFASEQERQHNPLGPVPKPATAAAPEQPAEKEKEPEREGRGGRAVTSAQVQPGSAARPDSVQTRAWLHGARNQYQSQRIEGWEGVAPSLKREAEAFNRSTDLQRGAEKRRRAYDELEEEYDLGRLKKVRSKTVLEEEGPAGNRFDAFQSQQAKGSGRGAQLHAGGGVSDRRGGRGGDRRQGGRGRGGERAGRGGGRGGGRKFGGRRGQ